MVLAIGLPNRGLIHAETTLSLIHGLLHFRQPKYIFMGVGGTIFQARNALAQQALDVKATHLLFIDSDMMFHPDCIKHILSLKKDIVGSDYNERGYPLISTVKIFNMKADVEEITEINTPTGPFKVRALGTGFMCIKTDVFNHIPQPWFAFDENEKGEFMGEDVYFCTKARKAGYDIWCDPTMGIKHIGYYAY